MINTTALIYVGYYYYYGEDGEMVTGLCVDGGATVRLPGYSPRYIIICCIYCSLRQQSSVYVSS